MKSPLLLVVLVAVAACASSTDPQSPPKQLTALPRSLTADEQRVSSATNQFALTLFKRLNQAQPGENVFVSPLSVSFALGMTMNGANGATLDEMRSTLGFGTTELAQINDGYRGLMALEAGLDPSTTFRIANSVWYRQGLSVNQPFVDALKQTFDADVRATPFDQGTVKQVNDWVSAKTNAKIPTIIDAISDDLVMFLINAIYFKGSWREQFDPAKTQNLPFRGLSGERTLPTMAREEGSGKFRYTNTASATIGELPYGNGAFVMTVVMPTDASGIAALAAGLDTASWTALLAPMQEVSFAVQLPKFKLSYERELKDDLIALGMDVPFSESAADFSRMTPAQAFIAFVKHKTYVDVNEEGTEAAAVTNTGMRVTSLPPCFCVNRPFVFAIRERFSGTILFIGKIVDIP